VASSAPFGIWHGTEASGNMLDAQLLNDIVPTGSLPAVSGKFTGAREFDGSHYAKVAISSGVWDKFTLQLWVYPYGFGSDQILGGFSNASLYQWSGILYITAAGKLKFYWYDFSYGGRDITGGTTLTLNAWQRVTVTLEPGQFAKLYVDGVSDATPVSVGAPFNLWSDGPLFNLGNVVPGSFAGYFNGRQCEVGLDTDIWDATEVLAASTTLPIGGGGTSEGSGDAHATFGATGVGYKASSGVGSPVVVFGTTGVGHVSKYSSPAAHITFGATGVGKENPAGAGAAGVTFGATGVGYKAPAGTGTAGVTFGATGVGGLFDAGAGTASVSFGATGVGKKTPYGSGDAHTTFGATGVGSSGDANGSGNAHATFGATGVGYKASSGSGLAGLALVVAAVGHKNSEGSGEATLTYHVIGTAASSVFTEFGWTVYSRERVWELLGRLRTVNAESRDRTWGSIHVFEEGR
jgi:hypothetical protein